MAKIKSIKIFMVDLKPETVRYDAIQSFVSQETPIVEITDEDGNTGVGYTYTIGTGGTSIVALIKDCIAPMIIGIEADNIERLWQDMLYHTHATSVGAITSLSMACLDIALWDLKSKKLSLPLSTLLGGCKDKIKVYSTEGGWLNLDNKQLVDNAILMQKKGFGGVKIKVGKHHIADDVDRLTAVRQAVGEKFEIMVDANQSFTLSEAIRRAKAFENLNLCWLEEPINADDVMAHKVLSTQTSIPIAVGESMYSLTQFKDYLQNNACTIIQADVARVGGITPWLKIANLAQAYNVELSPHFLMELHVSLCCSIPNSGWLEFIPQLTNIVNTTIKIENGYAYPSCQNGIGIDWNWGNIHKKTLLKHCIGD